jgi:hypothetical protein
MEMIIMRFEKVMNVMTGLRTEIISLKMGQPIEVSMVESM